jgi:hypothetical protein
MKMITTLLMYLNLDVDRSGQMIRGSQIHDSTQD